MPTGTLTPMPTTNTTPTPANWVVVDVETSGTDPQTCRVLSIAALALNPDGSIDDTLISLLNPGVDPGPTHIHGLTRHTLAGQPQFSDIAPALIALLDGRILVAHNAAFDYAFLAAEAHRANLTLPTSEVLCTVELAARLNLDTDNVKLATLAQHWGIPQSRPHDALDDAAVLARILTHALAAATDQHITVPIRPPSTLPAPTFTARPTAA